MSFAEHGIVGRIETKDGKKFFDMEKVNLEEIVKDDITILDYESDVKTQYGGGRCVPPRKREEVHHKFLHDKSHAPAGARAESLPDSDTRLEEAHREGTLRLLF